MHSVRNSRDLGGRDNLTQNGHSNDFDRESDDTRPYVSREQIAGNGFKSSQDEAIEELQRIYLRVSEPGPPVCKEPVPPDHLELSWNPSTYGQCREEVIPDIKMPEIDLAYILELQEASSFLTPFLQLLTQQI